MKKQSFLSSLLFFGGQNNDDSDWAKELKDADLSHIQAATQVISKQDWGPQNQEAQFIETQGEIGQEDIDFDAVEVEEIEAEEDDEVKKVQASKEEEPQFLSPLPVMRPPHRGELEEIEEQEEIIDFDEQQPGSKASKKVASEGMLSTIGFEEGGDRIYKLSELVLPHSASQKKYLMELNQRIIDTPGNLKLIDTILYPEKYYKKQQKKKQDYQRFLDQQLKREEKRAEQAVARYTEKIKHRTLKESNPELYWFTTKNPDPKVYDILKEMRPKLIYLERKNNDEIPLRKKKRVEVESNQVEEEGQRLKNFDQKKVEYRNETIDAICLGFTSISDLIRGNKKEEPLAQVEKEQPQKQLKREKKLNSKNLKKFAEQFVAQNKGSIQDIRAKTPWRQQWSLLVPQNHSSDRQKSEDIDNLFEEERPQVKEVENLSTQEGSKNWGYCYDDVSTTKQPQKRHGEKRREGQGELPFHHLQNEITSGISFEVIGKGNDIRKDFAEKSYRNPYIDSDEWLDILKKKKPYPWIIPPDQLDTWHIRKNPYKPLGNMVSAFSDNFDHIQAQLSGKLHGKVCSVAQQNEQEEKQVLSAMVISFEDKARTQGSRLEQIQHAKCIERMSYARMFWSDNDIKNMHRLSIQGILAQEANFLSAHIVTPRYLQQKAEKKSVLNPHDYFKARHKLTAKEGRIVLFEHIDQNPLLLCYFGMASRITRYVYNSPIPKHPFEMLKRNKLSKPDYDQLKHIGPFGPQIVMSSLAEHHKIPLIGKVDSSAYKGIAILENNMYRAPLFWHPIKSTDFILIKHKEQNGENQFYLRKASGLFTVGQEEPKVQAFNPATRNATAFFKKRTQACCLKMLEDVKRVPFSLFSKMFPEYTEQILKKFMKEVKIEFDRSQVCSLPIDQLTQRDYNILVTPEELCQFESCLRGQRHLHSLGIERIMSSDRVPSAVAKFASEEKDALTQSIARMIEREVLCTPWNVSNNFLAHKDRGMMRLTEIGDPSNGRGGYSFLKQPLKVSQDQLISRATNIGQPDAAATTVAFASAFQNPKAVTGTDADLRKQSKDQIHKQLVAFGMSEDEVASLPRWEAVAFLRQFSSQYTQRGEQGSYSKFARAIRLTGIKQRQLYWERVSNLFKQQMDTLSADDPNYSSEEEDTTSIISRKEEEEEKKEGGTASKLASTLLDFFKEQEEEQKKEEPVRIEAINQENQAFIEMEEEGGGQFPEALGQGDYGQKVLQFKGNSLPEVTHLRDIPGIEKLGDVGKVITESGATARQHTQLLQKVFRNEEGEIQKVLIISDERQIRSFLKRKKKSDQVMNRESQSKGMKRRAFQYLKDIRKKNAKPSPIALSLQYGDADLIKAAKGLSSGNRSEHHSAIALGLSGFDPATIEEEDIGIVGPTPKKQKQYEGSQGRGGGTYENERDQSYGGGRSRLGPASVSNMSSVRESSGKFQIRIGGDGRYQAVDNSHKTLKRSATKDSNDGEIYEGKRESKISRKRMGGAESEFNEKLADIIDDCILNDKSRLFHEEVRTKDFPDYYDKVKTPMALATLRGKCKRCEYDSLEQFKKDLIQIVTNSMTYNGENNIVTQMAREVVKFGFGLVEKDEAMLQAKSKAIAALKNRQL